MGIKAEKTLAVITAIACTLLILNSCSTPNTKEKNIFVVTPEVEPINYEISALTTGKACSSLINMSGETEPELHGYVDVPGGVGRIPDHEISKWEWYDYPLTLVTFGYWAIVKAALKSNPNGIDPYRVIKSAALYDAMSKMPPASYITYPQYDIETLDRGTRVCATVRAHALTAK